MDRILIVDDDEDLLNIITAHLQKAGYESDKAQDGKRALELARQNEYQLVLLDVRLPNVSGYEICRKLRENYFRPVLFMSCMDDDETICQALAMGGDDYIVKPVKPRQLLARIEANLRRADIYNRRFGQAEQGGELCFRRLTIDTARHEVLFRGNQVILSPIEYAILLHLTQNNGTLLRYDEIYRAVWQKDSLGDFRTVMVHVSNLRRKLDDGCGGVIRTMRGAGYIFTDE